MSDLISRKDAMMEARPEYLNPNQKGHEEYNKAWNDGVKAYWNGLKELPSELEWIPCSERLPEAGRFRHYLITLLDGHSYMDDVYEAWYTERGWWLGEELLLDGAVIAWQPLPEPYKEQIERSE